ncbi:MAG: peptidoglycan DD-metalloendopeptidase family protein [Alloprevotella sp.]|nr:peptidoglycan DD-metalloendopeptidase family protein [Alloprevotella sp.]
MSFLFVSSAQAQNKKIDKLKTQSEQLKKQMAESEQLLRTTKKDVKSQLNNLYVINNQLGKQQKYVDDIQTEVNSLGKDIDRLKLRIDSLEKDLNKCRERFRRSVMYLFKNRSFKSKWQFILSSKNFRQMQRRLRYASEYARYQKAQGVILRQKEDVLKAEQTKMLQLKGEKDQLLNEGKQQQQQLDAKRAEQQKVVNQLNSKQKQLQSTLAQQKKRITDLNRQIDRLIQQEVAAAERRRKQEEARRAAQAKKNNQSAATANNNKGKANAKGATGNASTAKPTFKNESQEDRIISNNFVANKGRLPVPITGSYAITGRFGAYTVSGLSNVRLDNPGINITGRPGAQARSVFKGEVTAVFAYAGLYNVIVRHGNYMTVYSNLSSVSVRKGQKVEARQNLGPIAGDGSGNVTLQFQIRQNTSKVNPESWLAL